MRFQVGDEFRTSGGGILKITNTIPTSYTHVYAICKICHKDEELFPVPIKVNKYKMRDGRLVCKCGNNAYKWNYDQYLVRINREAINRGYHVKNIPSILKNSTKILLVCDKGHDYKTTVDTFLNDDRKKGCAICAKKELSCKYRRPLPYVKEDLKNFMNWNSDFEIIGDWESKYTSSADIIRFKHKLCGSVVERSVRSLRRAKRISCCSNRGGSPKTGVGFFYVNIFLPPSGNYYLKYGITINNTRLRKNSQRRSAESGTRAFNLVTISLDNATAFHLEEALYNSFKLRRVSKEVLPDGYSETIGSPDSKDIERINTLITKFTGNRGALFWKKE